MANLWDKISKLFKTKEYNFHTDLSFSECVRKLNTTTVGDRLFGILRTQEVFSTVEGEVVTIRIRYRRDYVYFRGKIAAVQNGTLVIGRFVAQKVTIIFFIVVLIMWSIPSLLFPAGIFLTLFAACFIIIGIAFEFSRVEELIQEYLKTTLNAVQINPVLTKSEIKAKMDDIDWSDDSPYSSRRRPPQE